jgi:hypothetical protein
VPIDQNVHAPAAEPPVVSAIENEIPAYRAISAGAVFSLIFGILAILCYTHPFFLSFAALAVVLGILSDRKVQRLPDVLTGRGLAQAGIALGLTFGLTALTITTVQSFLLKREAGQFARQLEPVFSKGTLDDYFWYQRPPEIRATTTPEQVGKEMKGKTPDQRMIDFQLTPINDLRKALSEPGSDIHFAGIEGQADDGTSSYAYALYNVHIANPKTPGENETYAMAVLKGKRTGGKFGWWIEDVRYPYRPASYEPPTKQPDDGHGHAH